MISKKEIKRLKKAIFSILNENKNEIIFLYTKKFDKEGRENFCVVKGKINPHDAIYIEVVSKKNLNIDLAIKVKRSSNVFELYEKLRDEFAKLFVDKKYLLRDFNLRVVDAN